VSDVPPPSGDDDESYPGIWGGLEEERRGWIRFVTANIISAAMPFAVAYLYAAHAPVWTYCAMLAGTSYTVMVLCSTPNTRYRSYVLRHGMPCLAGIATEVGVFGLFVLAFALLTMLL
jgi:hypothetical protein